MTDYAHTTRATATALVSARLGDDSNTQHVAAEVAAALNESLRLFNVMTGHDRVRGVFPLTEGEPLYLLPSVLRDAAAELVRGQTVTDADLVAEVRFHLVETTATDQFSTARIVSALQQRRDRMLAETACVVSRVSVAVDSADAGMVELPTDIIAIRRAVLHCGARSYNLSRTGEQMAAATAPSFEAAGAPRMYSVAASGSNQLRIIPAPPTVGTLELIVVTAGATFDQSQLTSTLLGVPDDLAAGVKWGAIADLINDEESSDSARASLAEGIYTAHVIAATNAPVVLGAALSGVYTRPAAIAQTDRVQRGWQSARRGRVRTLSVVGPDAVIVTPVPDSSPQSVTMDVVRAMRLPLLDGDYLQIAREHLEPVLALTQWLLLFKVYESSTAQPLLDQFLAGARSYAARRRASCRALDTLWRISHKQEVEQPLEEDAAPVDSFTGEEADDPGEVLAERNARRRMGR
jgi:hypothetical protein